MRNLMTTLAAAGFGLLLAHSAQAAGSVEVAFDKPENFADIGFGQADRERTLAALAARFGALATRLPAGQVLKIDVRDVDLAGRLEPSRRGFDTRVLRGAADWPRLDLGWTLLADGKPIQAGQERLADMGYLQFGARLPSHTELPYEGRMIDEWFVRTFGGVKTAAAPAK